MSNLTFNQGDNPRRSFDWTIGMFWRHWMTRRPTDWKGRLRSSGLPDEIQQLIYVVANGSRLMRHEKYEITTELIAHFEDGNEGGRSFDRLSNEFGNPEVTAKLVRSSKIRNRSMYSKLSRMLALGGVGAATREWCHHPA